jgi:glycosyltransferase involved in cell wall biosynthesis
MKILYLVPHAPGPTKVRSNNQIRGLVNAGHQLTVATFVRNSEDAKQLERLQSLGVETIRVPLTRRELMTNALLRLPTSQPLQSAIMYSSKFMSCLDEAISTHPPDIVHVEHLRMAQYGLQLKDRFPTVWDAVDNLESLFKQASSDSDSRIYRLVAALEASRLPAYERWLTGQFAKTLVISKADQVLFQKDSPFAGRIKVVPFGLPLASNDAPANRVPNRLIMTGTLNYHPNIAAANYFVRRIFPEILRQNPSTHLQLVGANPHASIEALASPQIDVTGFVPSVADYLRQASIALAPVPYGSGIQIKVIEAFMTATPVVATPVALRGLDIRHEEQVLIAESPQEFAAAVIRLLNDTELRQRLGQAGRRYVEQHHDLQQTTATLVEEYLAVAAN